MSDLQHQLAETIATFTSKPQRLRATCAAIRKAMGAEIGLISKVEIGDPDLPDGHEDRWQWSWIGKPGEFNAADLPA